MSLRKSRKLQLPIDLQLRLFDSMIVPILLYGSEVTDFDNSDMYTRKAVYTVLQKYFEC